MKHSWIVLLLSLVLTACGSASTEGDNETVINSSLALPSYPSAEVLNNVDDGRDSETRLESNATLEDLYAFYNDLLVEDGWQRTDLESESDKVEAEYRKDGVKLELEIKREGAGVYKVELDFSDNDNRTSPPAGITLVNTFLGLPAYPGSTIIYLDEDDGDSEVRFESTAALQDIYANFHDFLTQEGWQQDDLETEDEEVEAEYSRDNVEFELELERNDAGFYELEVDFADDDDDNGDDDDDDDDSDDDNIGG